jgi:hypothetical protein
LAPPKSKIRLALAAALLLGAACKRAPVEVAPVTPDLAAPEPSSALIVTPLDRAATGYTNEMQAKALTEETSELGIQDVGKHTEEADDVQQEQAPEPPKDVKAARKERLARLKATREEFTRLRRTIDGDRDKSVALTGETAAIIKGRESGGMLGAVEDAPGVWSGAYGGAVETGERVVSDAAVWTELWGRLSRETPPAVDFAKTRVAAVFVGPRPTSGFRARLIGIAVEPTRYLVRWFEEGPGPDETVADGATAPYLLVSVPKDDRAIRWEKLRRSAGTEGPKTK